MCLTGTIEFQGTPDGVVQTRDGPGTCREVAGETPVVPHTTDSGAASVNVSIGRRVGIATIC
jgi:hypothetical protein